MTDNQVYDSQTSQRCGTSNDTAHDTVKAAFSKSWKCSFLLGVLVLANFLLIIVVGATLFSYQTELASQLNTEVLSVKISNTSGPPGIATIIDMWPSTLTS